MKKTSKIRHIILIITIIAGFLCVFTIGVQGKAIRHTFEGKAFQREFIVLDEWMEDDVRHILYYRENTLSGVMDGFGFLGYNEVYGHTKIKPTGYYTIHGNVTSYTTWNGFTGSYYGRFNVKGFMPVIPSRGDFTGKSVSHGDGDYKGWKQFATSWDIDEGTYGFSGTVLIPK